MRLWGRVRPMQPTLTLHAFLSGRALWPAEAGGMSDTIGVLEINQFSVSQGRRLLCGRWEPRDYLNATTARGALVQFDLVSGCRFYVVRHTPGECESPNGPIVWRWDEIRRDGAEDALACAA
jgi:hypothetical protein